MLDAAQALYLRLLKRCLTRMLFPDSRYDHESGDATHPLPFDPKRREIGCDWPTEAETMVGMLRLDNLESCVTQVVADGIPGDLVECGVWRGGSSIFMRGLLKVLNDTRRKVWVCDSFEGLPPPDPDKFPDDHGDAHWTLNAYLGVPLETVEANFRRYELLDEQVRFLKGWFRDTLPAGPFDDGIAVLRLDGDMYESTWVALESLYPKLARGGFVIIDDYSSWEGCRKAVDTFRSSVGITEPLAPIDWAAVYWRRAG